MNKTKMLKAIAVIECKAVEYGIYHKLKRSINSIKQLLINL